MNNQRSVVIWAAILGAVVTGIFAILAVYLTHYLAVSGKSVPSSNAPITNNSYNGTCITVTTQDGESAVVTGDVTINGNQYYINGDSSTGNLDIIGSNETANICGNWGFNVQTHIPNVQLESIVSSDKIYMENKNGCGSTCRNVNTHNV